MIELLHEVVKEIGAKPVNFAIEVVQFGILLVLIKMLAFGFGSRRGMVTNMLSNRRERVRQQLEDAAAAEGELAGARKQARRVLREARTDAKQIVETARQGAQEEDAAAVAGIHEEAAVALKQAEELLEQERQDTLTSVHDQLVGLVTGAMRQILNEGFTPEEQRGLIQKAVVEGLENLESLTLT